MDDTGTCDGKRDRRGLVPPGGYRDPEFDRLERERLWPRVWQMACREEELKVRGDFVTYEILGDSILIVRTGPGEDDVTAMYNVCQHRGRRLRDEPRGRIGRTIYCRYHGWQYGLSGELVHVHFEEDWQGCPGFEKSGGVRSDRQRAVRETHGLG